MKDRIVEFPHKYYDKVGGQLLDLEARPGIVTAAGSIYCKQNVLPETVCDLWGVNHITAEPADVFKLAAEPYRALPGIESNLTYLLALSEVNGNVQAYSNFFYDLFYAGMSAKPANIDNRYIAYTGSLVAGAATIPSLGLNFANFPITEANRNTQYQEMTISDGTNSEKVFLKNMTEFSSQDYTGTYPYTFSVQTAGTFSVTMKGGKAANSGFGGLTVYGGKGGTIVFNIAATPSDVFVVDKIPGAGYGVSLKKNDVLLAVVGGGGKPGGGFSFGGEGLTLGVNGGDGGGPDGQDPYPTPGGDGQWGGYNGYAAHGAVGGIGTGYAQLGNNNGGNAPNGIGGMHHVRDYNRNYHLEGYSGGGGYAGGGGSTETINDSFYAVGGGGGATSFVDSSIAAIENSRGTNSGAEFFLMAKQDVQLKDPLTKSYTNPIIYRGNWNLDTANHRASIKAINSVTPTTGELRMIIKNPQFNFMSLAMWLETTLNFTVTGVRVAFGSTQDIDETTAIAIGTTSYESTLRQTRMEALSEISTKYAMVIFDLAKSGIAVGYIYKVMGVIC